MGCRFKYHNKLPKYMMWRSTTPHISESCFACCCACHLAPVCYCCRRALTDQHCWLQITVSWSVSVIITSGRSKLHASDSELKDDTSLLLTTTWVQFHNTAIFIKVSFTGTDEWKWVGHPSEARSKLPRQPWAIYQWGHLFLQYGTRSKVLTKINKRWI